MQSMESRLISQAIKPLMKQITINTPKKVKDLEALITTEREKLKPYYELMKPIEEKIEDLKEKKKKFVGDASINCVGNIYAHETYVVTHWYTEPEGCTGGDYWNEGEHQLICNHCDGRIRLISENKHIMEHKNLFKEIIQEHEH